MARLMEKVFGAKENAANLIVIRRRRQATNSSNLLMAILV